MTDSIFQWPSSRKTSKRTRTTGIAIHCSATREGQDFDATDIDGWHRRQGWTGVGYHYVIHLDGTLEAGRPEDAVGSHIAGHNAETIGIVYIGGLGADGKPKDTRTEAQKTTMRTIVNHLIAKHRKTLTTIGGHRDFSPDKDKDGVVEPHEWLKACPSFDVPGWLITEGIKLP